MSLKEELSEEEERMTDRMNGLKLKVLDASGVDFRGVDEEIRGDGG